MKTLEEIIQSNNLSNITIASKENKSGCGLVNFIRWKGSIIFGIEDGWEHVSVAPFKKNIIPNWYEMKKIKQMFWNDEEEVMQFFPKESRYINVVENCLHLWRNPEVEALCSLL